MVGDDESDDIKDIKAEIQKFPTREFYPGLFDDFRLVNAELAARAVGRNRPRPGPVLQQKRDLSLKAHLIQRWRRRQRRLLKKAGFTDAHFSAIHHFTGRPEQIEGHLKYCKKTVQFRPGSNNIKVQRRLRHIAEAISVQGDSSGHKHKFSRLAQEAARQWP